MLTRRTILLAATSSIAACIATSRLANAGPRAADDASALAFVSAIYNSYTSGSKDGVRIDSGRKLRRYFEPCLADLMNKDQENAAKHHDVGELDADPFIEDTAPGKATATVTFVNFDEQQTIVLDDRNQKRLADLRYHLAARRRAENIARSISFDAARLRLAVETHERIGPRRLLRGAPFSGPRELERVKGIEPSS